MHENQGNSSRFQRRYEHGDADVRFTRPEIDIRKRNRNRGEGEQKRAHHQIGSYVLLYAVRVFLVLLGILRNIGRIIHGLDLCLYGKLTASLSERDISGWPFMAHRR